MSNLFSKAIGVLGWGPEANAPASFQASPASAAPAARQSVARTVTQLRPSRPRNDMSEIATVQPTSYSEAKDIAATYREGIPVIINMGELSELDARRLLDYLLGLRDGLNGQLKRVTQKVYLLSPSHVNIDDEDEDLNDAPAGDDLIISPIR